MQRHEHHRPTVPRIAVARALAGFGKAILPLGVAADRFDGLRKDGSALPPSRSALWRDKQAGRGTAAKVPGWKERRFPRSSRHVALQHDEATPAQSKPIPRVRPMTAREDDTLGIVSVF